MSTPPRSRAPCWAFPRSATWPSSACPTTTGARRSKRSSSRPRESSLPPSWPRRSSSTAPPGWPSSRRPSRSTSPRPFPGTPTASCTSASCATPTGRVAPRSDPAPARPGRRAGAGSDLGATLPVGVAQLALVQLAVGVPGKGLGEVDRLGRLELGQPGGAVLEDLLGQLGGRLDSLGRLDDRFDLLAPVVVGHAEDGHVADLGKAQQGALDLGGVDIGPARDDHVDLAVAEEQVAVLVDQADIADGEELADAIAGRLLLVLVVREVTGLHRHVHGADHVGLLDPVARVVEDGDLGDRPRLPDGARLEQPLLGGDQGAAEEWLLKPGTVG